MLGRRNRFEHRAERFRAVEQQLDGVVAVERGVGQALDDLVEHAHGFRRRPAPRLRRSRRRRARDARPSELCARRTAATAPPARATSSRAAILGLHRTNVAAPTSRIIKPSNRAKSMTTLRVATYNVHGHKGTDGKIVADRTLRRRSSSARRLRGAARVRQRTRADRRAAARALGAHARHARSVRSRRSSAAARSSATPCSRAGRLLEQHAHDVSLRGYRRRVVLEALVRGGRRHAADDVAAPRCEPARASAAGAAAVRAVQRDARRSPSLARRLQRMEPVQRGVAPPARALRRHAPARDVSVVGARRSVSIACGCIRAAACARRAWTRRRPRAVASDHLPLVATIDV